MAENKLILSECDSYEISGDRYVLREVCVSGGVRTTEIASRVRVIEPAEGRATHVVTTRVDGGGENVLFAVRASQRMDEYIHKSVVEYGLQLAEKKKARFIDDVQNSFS